MDPDPSTQAPEAKQSKLLVHGMRSGGGLEYVVYGLSTSMSGGGGGLAGKGGDIGGARGDMAMSPAHCEGFCFCARRRLHEHTARVEHTY